MVFRCVVGCVLRVLFFFFFFFQAEDGIRDWSVTGVQTCALPIYIIILGSTGFYSGKKTEVAKSKHRICMEKCVLQLDRKSVV